MKPTQESNASSSSGGQSVRILVTGPRDYPSSVRSIEWLAGILMHAHAAYPGHHVTFVHGHCPTGVDASTDRWVTMMQGALGVQISVERHPAQDHPTQDFGPWPGAGPRRNQYMASRGAAKCVAVMVTCARPGCARPQPHYTHGTANCVLAATRAGIPVERYYP